MGTRRTGGRLSVWCRRLVRRRRGGAAEASLQACVKETQGECEMQQAKSFQNGEDGPPK